MTDHDLCYSHVALRTKAVQVKNIEKVVQAMSGQRRALGEDLPDLALAALDEGIDKLKPIRRKLLGELETIVAGSPLGEWISETHGLGKGLILLLGICPPLTEFDTVSAVWKYAGLHVSDGSAVRGQRGQRLGFDPVRRAYAIKRVADPIMKVGGPYREVYDDRRAHTLGTHPPMLDEDGELAHPGCEHCAEAMAKTKRHREGREYTRRRSAPSFDCSNLGGVHWTDGHRHADALRVTAKAVLRDAYRVVRGQPPRVGPNSRDDHDDTAHAEAA